MIMLPSAVRIFLCTRPTDMRKSFDGLTGLVQECFGQDPLSGHLFLFVNRRRDRIKILYFDRDGLALWYKGGESGAIGGPLAPTLRLRDAFSMALGSARGRSRHFLASLAA